MDQLYDRDCTSKCRSSVHAQNIFNCIPSASTSQIRAYSVWVCHNFPVITDNYGRNMLHVAAACGKREIVEWLITNCNVDIDMKDKESGWSALHRSLFYGQLASAKILCNLGASLHLIDHEGYTPLDIILKDRLPYIEYISSHPSEVYAWGSNFNYNLGFGSAESKTVPEILEVFRKDAICLKQIAICKFHSAFLSNQGKVYTCGSGHGGRLGQGNEEISLNPTIVKGIGDMNCTQIAVGQDHLLMLIEPGQVWSCGWNLFHQLGHIPPMEHLLVPRPLSLKFLKGKKICGIRAARFHSVIFTKDCVYTFGLNAGQLGHPKGERTQINPRMVSTLFNESWEITHVETSDGAIVCATNRGDIYVLHEYQTRKIASRQLEISKLSVVGGHLDSRCDVAGVREGGGFELKVMLLTKSGKVYLWRQTDPYLRRCLFTTQKELIILDMHINNYTVGLITSENEGYIGKIVPFKGTRSARPVNVHTPAVFNNSKAMYGLNFLLDTDECSFIKVKKLPHIYRGTSITSDSKGRNFAILQSNPKMGLVEIPMVSESEMLQDLKNLYSETFIGNDFYDIVIKVESTKFPAHKFILSSRSDFFKKQISLDFEMNELNVESVKAEAVEQVLKFIYTNHCDFLTQGFEVNWKTEEVGKKKKCGGKSKVNPILILQDCSRKLGMGILAKKLEGVKLINGQINLIESSPDEKIIFNRCSLSQLCDVNLLSSDGIVFSCHKCILIARLDYFHTMLSTVWTESSDLGKLSLPIESKILEVILDYIYSDKAIKILDSEDPEFLCHVLLTADKLLIPRLKEICELALIELITLKNAAELLELASIYNSIQLKQSCMQFICINLAALIEAKSLDVLSDDVIQDLSVYYRNLVPSMRSRRIFSSDQPSASVLEHVEKSFPVDTTSTFIRNRLDLQDTKIKRRRNDSTRIEVKAIAPNIRNKTYSETSEKDIVLEMVISDISGCKVTEENSVHPKCVVSPENKRNSEEKILKTSIKPSQRTLQSPNVVQVISLDQIMLEEQQKLNVISKKNSRVMKPMPHLSQKTIGQQKKLLESKTPNKNNILVINSPSAASCCPWAKFPQQSPTSPSFWDAVANKDFPNLNNDLACGSKNKSENCVDNQASSPVQQISQEPVMSLNAIQKAEQLKLHKAANLIIKPLHIINIEDQAIEELLTLYNAKDNSKERITISRVVPDEIASPVWKNAPFKLF